MSSPGKWQVWAKNGTLYEFSTQALWTFCNTNEAPPTVEPYSWKLTSVTDTHGNRINYTYGRFQDSYTDICHKGVNATLDHDIWPTAITWGGNINQATPDRYRVDFISNYRSYDRQHETVAQQAGYIEQTQRLDYIQVKSNSSNPFNAGSWQLVRQYNLCYAGVTSPCNTYAGSQATQTDYDDGYGPYWKLTLKSIQRIANDGTTALPATVFTYGTTHYPAGSNTWVAGGWNRITNVNNGQGGTLDFSYDEIGWVLLQQGYNLAPYKNNRRIIAKTISDGRGHSYTWNYSYGTPAYNTLGTWNFGWRGPNTSMNSAAQFFNVYYYDRAGIWDQQGEMVHPYGKEFRGHSYAIVTDPNGTQTEHYFYQGDHPCGQPSSPFNTVFPTDTCFLQLREREMLRGKEWLTRIRGPVSAGSPIMTETWHNFKVDFYDYGPNPISGLWRGFGYEYQTITKNFEGGSTPLTKTTNYDYSTGYQAGGIFYGNLGRVDELDQNGTLYRRTEHWYASRNDATSYIVDREWATGISTVQNNQSQWLAFSFKFYDGYTVVDPSTYHLPVGTKGDVTMTRQLFDIPLTLTAGQPLHGVDSTLAYDAYGNPTGVTTYAGNGQSPAYAGAGTAAWNPTGWVFGSAGNGAAGLTTSTTYDSVFHAFPTQITQPPATVAANPMSVSAAYDYRMGTLTGITDENSITSNAEYDGFGRMVKLIKPGDTSASPTQSYQYNDWEYNWNRPVSYYISLNAQDVHGGRPVLKFYDGLGRLIQTKSESIDAGQLIVEDQVYDGLGHVTQQSQPRYVNQNTTDPGIPFWYYATPSTDPNVMRWTATTYDALGRPSVVTAPDGTTTRYYHGVGQWPAGGAWVSFDGMVDANRHLKVIHNDEFGRNLRVFEYTGNCGYWNLTCAAPYTTGYAIYATTSYSYSVLDQLKQVTDNANNVTILNYDTLGRKTSMTDPDMGLWSYFYDISGNLIQQTDAKSQSITFTYDNLNRLVTKNGAYSQNVFFSDSFNSQNGSNWSWNSTYQTVPFNDNGNNVVKSTGNGVDTSEGVGRVGNNLSSGMGTQVRFKVDSTTTNAHFFVDNGTGGYRRFGAVANNGKLYTEYTTDGVNWTYPGDLISNLQTNVWYVLKIELDDTNGFKIQVNQESNGAVQGSYSATMPSGMSWHFAHLTQSGNTYLDDYREYTIGTPASNYYYDDTVSSGYGKGKRTSMTNSGGTTRWFYDNRGRVTKTDYTLSGLTGTRRFQTTYDNADRVTSVQYPNLANPTDPNGEIVSYSYDAAWRPTQACSNLTGTPCYASAAQYNALSQPTQLTFGNTLQQNWTYSSPMSRLSQLRVGTSSTPGSLFDRSYTYDNASNVKTIANNLGWQAQTQNFSYDDLDRLNHGWTSGSSSNGTNVKINFQTSTSQTPAGYLPDSGAVYGDRGNGYTYGWNADNSANARDRDAPNSPDQRYDTFTHMQKPNNPNATWEIAVPNGTYTVRVVAGDPSNYGDATFKINVENVLALEGSPTSDNHWFDQTAVVQVTDGKLTVSNATGSNNNKIDFIEITSGPGAYDESYSYDQIGNITSKAGVSYTYPAGGSARPHTPLTVGGAAYSYDGNGNLLSGGGRSYTWNVENKPTAVTGPDGVTEGYNYDADGERVSRSRSGTTTYYFGGMWEEDSSGTIRAMYQFGGKVVATRQRVSGVDTVSYLHGDHLGSVSLATNSSGAVANQQEFDPWGKVRLGGMSQTTLNYTAQRLDGTGLLYYHARYYDPGLGKFVSADSIVPGAASGKGGANTLGLDNQMQLHSLAVDFHESSLATQLAAENSLTIEKGFWFQLNGQDRQKAKSPFGPSNPQSLNRYSYTLNNPIRYIDPTGHTIYMGHDEALAYLQELKDIQRNVANIGGILKDIAAGVLIGDAAATALAAGLAVLKGISPVGALIAGIVIGSLSIGLNIVGDKLKDWSDYLKDFLIPTVEKNIGDSGLIIHTDSGCSGIAGMNCTATILNRDSGYGNTYSTSPQGWLGAALYGIMQVAFCKLVGILSPQ